MPGKVVGCIDTGDVIISITTGFAYLNVPPGVFWVCCKWHQ
jgi:hypothetical protein